MAKTQTFLRSLERANFRIFNILLAFAQALADLRSIIFTSNAPRELTISKLHMKIVILNGHRGKAAGILQAPT